MLYCSCIIDAKMKTFPAILFLQLIWIIYGTHFRGGTMSWRPTGVGNQVEVTYRLSNNGFRIGGSLPPSGHETCTQDAKDSGQMLTTTGYIYCDGCENFYYRDMIWKCTDFDEEANWDIGQDSFNITIPDVNQKAVLYHERCCWVNNLRNAPPKNALQGYKMMTEIDLQPRADGRVNSSPVTAAIPVQQFHSGCTYHLEIPATDPDDDPYRCRYTNEWDNECYNPNNGKHGDICHELSYITIYDNCTLKFDASGGPGYYAVRLMIEDLDENGDPMSFVSLSFLLYVHPDDTTCDVPVIKQPLYACKTIPVGYFYEELVVVEAASPELPIKRIETSKPPGMTMSPIANVTRNPLQRYVMLNWVPTRDMIGKQTIGINAVDNGGFTSGWSFLVLNVADIPPLQPVPEESSPAAGGQIRTNRAWELKFNTEIQRPTNPAFIGLLNSNGNIIGVLDVSNENHASYAGDRVTFSFPGLRPLPGTHEYRLIVEPGVAVTNGINNNCPMYSLSAEWNVFVTGPEKPTGAPPGPQGPPAPPAPMPTSAASGQVPSPTYSCMSEETSVATDAQEGALCFVHLETAHTTVTDGNINLSYKLCCPTDCSATNPLIQPEMPDEFQPGENADDSLDRPSPETPKEAGPVEAIVTDGPVTPTVDGMGAVEPDRRYNAISGRLR